MEQKDRPSRPGRSDSYATYEHKPVKGHIWGVNWAELHSGHGSEACHGGGILKKAAKVEAGKSAAKQIELALSRFDPAVARLVASSRRVLRKRFPTAIEQVYDNYNFFVIGFCTTERTSDCIVSLAASAKGVALSFYYGAALPDPHKVLLGSGKQNRFVRLESTATLSDPRVVALIDAAAAQAKTPLPSTGKGHTMIKSVSARQRPRGKAVN